MPLISKTFQRLSVIICTFNRAESLRETLRLLAQADRTGLDVEVLIVDNGSSDHTPGVVEEFSTILPVRYLCEPVKGTYGKAHSLNRGIHYEGLGDLVAVLDDDMSVLTDWFQGVRAIADRHPEVDLFTGSSYVIWPDVPIPSWAKYRYIHGWLISDMGCRAKERSLPSGQWFSGGHFWFRSRILADGRCFEDKWLTEPAFMLSLIEDGFKAVQGPDAVVGHRVQPYLLDPMVAIKRAEMTGASFAEVRLLPVRRTVRHSQLARKYPYLARIFCALKIIQWSLEYWRLRNIEFDQFKFGRKLLAIERRACFREMFRILTTSREYQVSLRRGGALVADG